MREQPGQTMQEESLPRFGNYDLVRRIDVGGMGEVYLAHQRSAFGRDVAIKIIRSDLVHDVTARARFLREAEVSAHLKHEHILPLFEFGEDQGRLFLVTPYIEGGTLARHLKRGPLTLEEVHLLFVPLVQAVAYIHRRGVIHRDLKPTNILLDEVLQNFEQAYQLLMTSYQQSSRIISTPVSPGQSSSRHLSNALNRSSNALVDENVDIDERELVSLQHSGYIPVAIPQQSQSSF